MPFIKAQPNEFLVTGQGGRVVNRGAAVSVYLWPGSSYVLIPATQQEASFEMTQESKDGIPLRFKGLVVYRVVRPEQTARMFDFSHGQLGHEQIKNLLSHVCLGELRAHVAHMTMQECIEQRKTSLTDAVSAALRVAVQGGEGWGIELDVVQVAQVFIVDQELRRQLEAEVRNQIRSSSELSNIRMAEEIRLAKTASERNLLQENLETDRERSRIDKERAQLELALEQERVRAGQEAARERTRLEAEHRAVQMEAQKRQVELDAEHRAVQVEAQKRQVRLDAELQREREASQLALEQRKLEEEAPLRLLQLQNEKERLERHLEVLRLQLEVEELEVKMQMLSRRAEHELKKDLLPLENVPVVADAVSKMFQGAQLSFYGESSGLLGALTPALGMLGQTLGAVKVPVNGQAQAVSLQ